MPALILYLLKVNIALMLFYLAYRFALRRLTFYTLNRFFLLCGILFSSLYPFINISALIQKHEVINQKLIVIVPDWNNVQQTVISSSPDFNYWLMLEILFWTGALLMAARLVIRLLSLYRIHSNSISDIYEGYKYRKINEDVNPFAFLQNIYLNPQKIKEGDLTSVLKHEQVHVKEWHTLDVLLAELNIVFYWFNPGVWMIKNAVKENLEFITDRRVLKAGVDCKSYQYSLIALSTSSKNYSLVNNFNIPDIKKRIIMMNKKRSSNKQMSRYALLLPLVIVLSLVFTVSKAQLEKTKNAFKTGALSLDWPGLPETKSDPVQKEPILIEESITAVKDTSHLENLNGLVIRGGKQPLYIIDGIIKKDSTSLKALDPDDIKNISVYKDAGAMERYGKAGENGVIIITTKGSKETSSSELQEVQTRKSPLTVVLDGKRELGPPPLYIVDGVTIEGDLKTKNVTSNDITSISVIKNSSAASIYGKQAENGIIFIKTKNAVSIFPAELSPDNDGVNDLFSLRGIEKFGAVNIKIYDKSGTLVYDQSNYKNDWKGKDLSDKDLVAGQYYSIITFANNDQIFSGSFNIVK